MTDIKEPINTTSDGTFLSVECENPEKSVVGQKLGGAVAPPPPQPPQELPPCFQCLPLLFDKLKEIIGLTLFYKNRSSSLFLIYFSSLIILFSLFSFFFLLD